MPVSIGEVVKNLRKEHRLSQYDIERESGGTVNRNWLASLEKGNIANPPQAKLAALAEILGTTVTDIYSLAGIIDIPSNLPPEDKEVLDLIHRMSGATRRIAIGVLRQLNGAESVTTEEEDAARAQKKAT